ncbi:hypothetical protein [uncultured Roseibium sp.]|uniref:hypothetical protein n=1 Tax=uncultured Roseibium sp. TaxID=1936171 RepID=UPI0026206EDE|nr:hypothetical protein [uncultured Roseibium sp.]
MKRSAFNWSFIVYVIWFPIFYIIFSLVFSVLVSSIYFHDGINLLNNILGGALFLLLSSALCCLLFYRVEQLPQHSPGTKAYGATVIAIVLVFFAFVGSVRLIYGVGTPFAPMLMHAGLLHHDMVFRLSISSMFSENALITAGVNGYVNTISPSLFEVSLGGLSALLGTNPIDVFYPYFSGFVPAIWIMLLVAIPIVLGAPVLSAAWAPVAIATISLFSLTVEVPYWGMKPFINAPYAFALMFLLLQVFVLVRLALASKAYKETDMPFRTAAKFCALMVLVATLATASKIQVGYVTSAGACIAILILPMRLVHRLALLAVCSVLLALAGFYAIYFSLEFVGGLEIIVKWKLLALHAGVALLLLLLMVTDRDSSVKWLSLPLTVMLLAALVTPTLYASGNQETFFHNQALWISVPVIVGIASNRKFLQSRVTLKIALAVVVAINALTIFELADNNDMRARMDRSLQRIASSLQASDPLLTQTLNAVQQAADQFDDSLNVGLFIPHENDEFWALGYSCIFPNFYLQANTGMALLVGNRPTTERCPNPIAGYQSIWQNLTPPYTPDELCPIARSRSIDVVILVNDIDRRPLSVFDCKEN